MYEPRRAKPVSWPVFLRRLARHFAVASALMAVSLFAGMAGYVYFEKLSWLDAFLNAAMLLGGMGPVESPATPGGKLFAGSYALFAGLFFLAVAGVLLAPVAHRLLHEFHWDKDGK